MKKTKCKKCNREITNANFKKHYNVCGNRTKYDKGGNYIKSIECKHCNKSWKALDITKSSNIANHMRWCDKNLKREHYIKATSKMRNGITVKSRKLQGEGVKRAHERGCYDHVEHKTFLGKKHTEETKDKMRQKALNSPHRRLRRGMIEYNGIMLDSSWELELAKRLDELKIKWKRPEPIKWVDKNNIKHNYFSDFYLPEYDVYLDPKNPQAYKVQKEKINVLKKTYSNLIFIKTLEECKTFII